MSTYDRYPAVDSSGNFPPQVVSALRTSIGYYKRLVTAGIDAATADPGLYVVTTFTSSRSITPDLPVAAYGAGILEVKAVTSGYSGPRSLLWTVIGTTESPKPIWKNDYNPAYGWYGWHRITPEPPPNNDPNSITLFGDSHTDASVVGGWASVAAPLLEHSLVNRARSGDDTFGVGLSAGWLSFQVLVEGSLIPSSGAVTVRALEKVTTRTNRLQRSPMVIEGVPGSLRHVADGVFTFTRSTSGDSVSVPGPTVVKSTSLVDSSTVMVWMGGNNFNGVLAGSYNSISENVIADYLKAKEWAENLGKTLLIAGTTNRDSAPPGTDGFTQIREINRRLREYFPETFLDVQGYLSEFAIYDLGLSPTETDLQRMEGGAIPPQIMESDGIHLKPATHAALATNRIVPWLVDRGFAHAKDPSSISSLNALSVSSTEKTLEELRSRLAALESKVE